MMKIKNITIEGFKGIEKMEYVPTTSIGILTAPNGSGKTSFFQALELLLGNTNKEKTFIREGCPMATVSLETENNIFSRILSREKRNAFQVNKKSVTEVEFYDALKEETKMSAEDFQVLSSSELFERLSSNELAKYFNSKGKNKLTMDDLVDFLPSDFPEDGFLILENKLDYEFNPANISDLYSDFYATRCEINRTLKEHKASCSQMVSKPDFTKEELEIQEKEVQEKRSDFKVYEVEQNSYKKALDNFLQMSEQRKVLEKKVKAAFVFEPKQEDLDNAKKEKESFLEQERQIYEYCNTIKSNTQIFRKTLDNLNTNICPISEKLICSTDKTQIKGELQESIKKNEQILAVGEKKIAEIKTLKECLDKKIEDLQNTFMQWNNYCNLKKQLESFKLPLKPEEPKQKAYDIDVLNMEMDSIAAKKEHLKNYETYMENKKKYDESYNNYKLYDSLVKATDPKGLVIKNVLEKYFSAFNQIIEKTITSLGLSCKIKLVIDKDVKCVFEKEGMIRNYDMLSNGEKVMVTMIVLDALNQAVGNKMLFIDNLNELDEENQKTVLSFVSELKEYYDNIFISGTNKINLSNVDNISLK